MKKYSEFFIFIFSSILAQVLFANFINTFIAYYPFGTITSYIWWTWSVIAICILFSVFVIFKYFQIKDIGISRILDSSSKGEGSTKNFMNSAKQKVDFMGIGASKWTKEDLLLRETICRIASTQTGMIRFLLLEPNSEEAECLSRGQTNGDDLKIVGDTINKSLSKLYGIIESAGLLNNSRVEVRLYRQMPVYRLAIIDNKVAYLSFYKIGRSGENNKQIVIHPGKKQRENDDSIYYGLTEYFESVWNAKTTKRVKYSQIQQMKDTEH